MQMDLKSSVREDSLIISNVSGSMILIVDSVSHNRDSFFFKVNLNDIVDTTLDIDEGGKKIVNSYRKNYELTKEERNEFMEVRPLLEQSMYMVLDKKGKLISPLQFSNGNYPPDFMIDFNNVLLHYPESKLKMNAIWQYSIKTRLNFNNSFRCRVSDIKGDSMYINVECILGSMAGPIQGTREFIIDTLTGRLLQMHSEIEISIGKKIIEGIHSNYIGNLHSMDMNDFDNKAFERSEKINTIIAYNQYIRDFPNGKHANKAKNKIIELYTLSLKEFKFRDDE